MKLQKIAEELNKNFNFPYQVIEKNNGFTDSVYICISLDRRENWGNGILENSRYLKTFIFCDKEDRETKNSTYKFYGTRVTKDKNEAIYLTLRSCKNKSGDEIYKHVTNQLKKLTYL